MVEEEASSSPAGGLLSRFRWRLRSSAPIRLDSVSVVDGRYLATTRANNVRLFSLLRVHLADQVDEARLDYSAAVRITLQHQRMKGLLDGLHRARIPFLYTMMVKPSNGSDEEENQVFEFDLVVGTWVDAPGKGAEEAMSDCERNASTLAATLSVGLPNSSVRRLTRNELAGFAQTLLLPTEPRLRQVANAATLSSLESFEGHGPNVAPASVAPDFYTPNARESGETGEGVVLGRIKARSGVGHEFRLQLDDLRRHVSLIGMTGSGKSTTAAVIVRQVAAMGLPVMILDWHNEHGDLVRSVGGQVVSPGRDDFAINPMDMGPSTEPAEHVEMVTDIFSDTYHFTHPQAYMFRNALQRCISEAGEKEVPTLASLVSTIEAYPLRSAYDNETKVALLRRLVPLTQGNVGRAFNSPSSHTVDELLDKVLCVELGHIRETLSRSIFADIILKLVYEVRLARKVRMEHLTMVEEARNIAPVRREEDPPSVGERMVSELRKFGESMLFVAQFPSQVAPEVVKNSGVRVIHRVAWAEDLRLVRDSLNLTQEQLAHVSNLGVGEAVVSLTRLQRPILVQVGAAGPFPSRSDLNVVGEP
ncbi:MAG: ATP-binding protein [Nitrososphaerota archaeon]|nr:ATP-binding protein [Nitrososphaerota archaeon]MDG6978000.1 ATP-binding protein [Nitrososphaerota archaeon]MDG7020924.1 ATP-binding protein [Nitrososphaerota archaeon]MDG7022613.1 ATP-binding protein [Nitrososphaerota archaeon]